MADLTLQDLQRLPKTDLHVHLDGSLKLETILALAEAQKVRLPGSGEYPAFVRQGNAIPISFVEFQPVVREYPIVFTSGDKALYFGSDPEFLANFKALDASHPITAVKHGTKKNPWEIDAISGATISSRAVGRLLAGSVKEMAPLIERNKDRIERGN